MTRFYYVMHRPFGSSEMGILIRELADPELCSVRSLFIRDPELPLESSYRITFIEHIVVIYLDAGYALVLTNDFEYSCTDCREGDGGWLCRCLERLDSGWGRVVDVYDDGC